MRCSFACLVAAALAFAQHAAAQDEQENNADDGFDVAKAYEQIVADYQRIEATGNSDARAAASHLVGFAYRHVIEQAKSLPELDAEDLYALGACHEGLGEIEQAKRLYAESLEIEAHTRTHLALTRVNMRDDLKTADTHFTAALKLDPEYPGIAEFRLFLAAAYQGQRDWDNAIRHLERFHGYVKALVARQPSNQQARNTLGRIEWRLERLRRFVELTGASAPPLDAEHWIQGDPVALDELAGKAVVVDFFATWARPCRPRIERLKKLHEKYKDRGLEVIGLTLAYGHHYNPETDAVTPNAGRSPEEERQDTAAFAKKQAIGYRLATITRKTIDAYGVDTLPHTVLLDREGKVTMILQTGGKAGEAELEANIRAVLESE